MCFLLLDFRYHSQAPGPPQVCQHRLNLRAEAPDEVQQLRDVICWYETLGGGFNMWSELGLVPFRRDGHPSLNRPLHSCNTGWKWKERPGPQH